MKEIFDQFGISESGVSVVSRRMALEIQRDAGLRAKVARIRKKMVL